MQRLMVEAGVGGRQLGLVHRRQRAEPVQNISLGRDRRGDDAVILGGAGSGWRLRSAEEVWGGSV